MRQLVFIHGWGLTPAFWDGLAAKLTEFPQYRVDGGFFGNAAEMPAIDFSNAVLIGHSLGFLRGVQLSTHWAGLVAINGFARFVAAPDRIGCTSGAVLRDLRRRLAADPLATLAEFHRYIGAQPPAGMPQEDALRDGLDDLRDGDIGMALAGVTAPSLVLAGRTDPLVPVAASADLAGGGGGALHWHESGGHVLPQADPVWCADHIRRLLATL